MIKIVNQSVPSVLDRLGYDSAQSDDIIRYIDGFSTSYRILDGTDPYYITSFSEIGRQEGLRIIAEARDND